MFTLQWASFQGLQFDCDLLFLINILVCTTTDDAGIEKLHFRFSWNLKNAFQMLFESKYKRNWICVKNVKVWKEGIPPCCAQLVQRGPFYQIRISHSNTKYYITNIKAAWTWNYKKDFLVFKTWWTAAFVNTSPT